MGQAPEQSDKYLFIFFIIPPKTLFLYPPKLCLGGM